MNCFKPDGGSFAGRCVGPQISPPGQEGWLRHKEKGRLPCWRRRGGRSSTEAIMSAARALIYLPPRRSRSKTIARVSPSCPGGEICWLIHLPQDYLEALKPGLQTFAASRHRD